MSFGTIKTGTELSTISILKSYVQCFHTSPTSEGGNNPNLLRYSKGEELFQELEQVLGSESKEILVYTPTKQSRSKHK